MKNYLKLLRFLKGHKLIFSGAVLAMLVSSVFEGIQLSLLVPLTDRIFTQKPIVLPSGKMPSFVVDMVNYLNSMDPDTMFALTPIVVLLLLLIKHVFVYFYQYLMNDVSQRVMRDVRQQLYAKIQSLSLDYFSEKRTGELMSRITNDVSAIENAVSYGVTDLFRQTFMIAMYIAIAFSLYFKAALIIFFVFPFIGYPISLIGRRLRKLSKQSQERMADINSIILETISGIKVVKAFCTEDYERGRFRGKNHDFYKLKMKSVRRLLWLAPITEIFGAVCGVLLILWLGKEVMAQQMSFGVFVLFFGSIMSIISPIKKLGNVNALTQQALAANDRIYEILDQKPSVEEAAGARALPPITRGIEFRGVSFQYEDRSGQVLKDINLEIKVGELVAIVGPTGTGKTTLVNLIPRFYDPSRGEVRIDGMNLREVSFPSLRRQIGIVAQETFLFNDTVGANIAYGYSDASKTEIEAAAHKAYAHHFIDAMPNGYDTVIGDRGFRLSGGEKQRIAIARAILKNPPILILDEATSQLDSESEKYVQRALDELMEGRTVIAIAHRLSTVVNADKIVVLEQGRVVGLGRHDNLLKTCPLYQRLYETQFMVT
ncbi:MAG: ABC transporter ATP-binding protein [Candidatus Omnitrophota bacterium]|nr:ABC transporter ATP-binding protein [Candidatus Omnitrophota bacterium]MDZ4241667.1 ABC transporter ATP-binding protein [Candidatus Omnitrophota bacterium]